MGAVPDCEEGHHDEYPTLLQGIVVVVAGKFVLEGEEIDVILADKLGESADLVVGVDEEQGLPMALDVPFEVAKILRLLQ